MPELPKDLDPARPSRRELWRLRFKYLRWTPAQIQRKITREIERRYA